MSCVCVSFPLMCAVRPCTESEDDIVYCNIALLNIIKTVAVDGVAVDRRILQ